MGYLALPLYHSGVGYSIMRQCSAPPRVGYNGWVWRETTEAPCARGEYDVSKSYTKSGPGRAHAKRPGKFLCAATGRGSLAEWDRFVSACLRTGERVPRERRAFLDGSPQDPEGGLHG